MQNENRNVDALEIRGEIGFREVSNAVIRRLEARVHSLLPPMADLTLALLSPGSIESKEWPTRDVKEELSTILVHSLSERVENRLLSALCILRGFDHQRWDSANENGLLNAARAVFAQETGNLTTTV